MECPTETCIGASQLQLIFTNYHHEISVAVTKPNMTINVIFLAFAMCVSGKSRYLRNHTQHGRWILILVTTREHSKWKNRLLWLCPEMYMMYISGERCIPDLSANKTQIYVYVVYVHWNVFAGFGVSRGCHFLWSLMCKPNNSARPPQWNIHLLVGCWFPGLKHFPGARLVLYWHFTN